MKIEKIIVDKVNELANNDFASNYQLMNDMKMDIIDCLAYSVSEHLELESSEVYDLLMNLNK